MNIETMRLLVAKGFSADDLLEVAETMAGPADRSAAALRQARYRERKKAEAQGITCDVTRDGDSDATDVTDPPLSRPPNEIKSNPPTHTPETHTPRTRADDFPCPDWAEKPVWADLKRNRKTKKLTNTATAHSQFIAAIEAMADEDWPPGRLLKAIVAKGWGGAHDPREDRKPKNGTSFKPRASVREIAERALTSRNGPVDSAPQLLPGPRSAGGYG